MPNKHKNKVWKIGPEKQEFELELTPVTIHKTFKGRIVDAIWTAIASGVAITVFHVVVLPLL